jgi:hypothetical protein
MENEPMVQMQTDRMKLRYAYHIPFVVNSPDKCEWQDMFKPDTKGAWSGMQMGPRPMK